MTWHVKRTRVAPGRGGLMADKVGQVRYSAPFATREVAEIEARAWPASQWRCEVVEGVPPK